jgi:CRISPR-associated protein Cas1
MRGSILHFGNPCRLSLKLDQLVIQKADGQTLTRPLEDIAVIVVDHGEVSLSTPLMARAAQMGVGIVFCDEKHLPVAYSSPMVGHTLQNLRHRQQWAAGQVVHKQAWAQVIRKKLLNQADTLKLLGKDCATLRRMAKDVKSGDSSNEEAKGAKYYWNQLLGRDFVRERYGDFPNNYLNYGYAIVRAGMARALSGAGLCLTIGIFHHNQYNPFALADDCMEPFRPWVDLEVIRMLHEAKGQELDKEAKARLLLILQQDVQFEGYRRPMMGAMDQLASSLAHLFEGRKKDLDLPSLPIA